MGNFKRGPGFERIQLMIGVRPATQDKESSVEITRCPYWYVSKGRGRKGEGKRDPRLSFRIFVDLSSPSPFFAAATQAT